MGKDPALLWYPGDWNQGTQLFTFEEKGAYMTLLMAQFESYALSESDIHHLLGNRSEAIWSRICVKFKQDVDGKFYNERIREEKERRIKYTDSRKKNLMKSHMGKHMVGHMENENRNILSNTKEGGSGETKAPVNQNHIGIAEHWRSHLTEQHKISFRKILLSKFTHATEDQINTSMFLYLSWWDLRFPDGGLKKQFTGHFQYFIDGLKALPTVQHQQQKPYGRS